MIPRSDTSRHQHLSQGRDKSHGFWRLYLHPSSKALRLLCFSPLLLILISKPACRKPSEKASTAAGKSATLISVFLTFVSHYSSDSNPQPLEYSPPFRGLPAVFEPRFALFILFFRSLTWLFCNDIECELILFKTIFSQKVFNKTDAGQC